MSKRERTLWILFLIGNVVAAYISYRQRDEFAMAMTCMSIGLVIVMLWRRGR